MKSLTSYIIESQKDTEFESWLVDSITKYLKDGKLSYEESAEFRQKLFDYIWKFSNNDPKMYRKYNANAAKGKFYVCQQFDRDMETKELLIGIKGENGFEDFRLSRGESYGWYAQRSGSFTAPKGSSIYYLPKEYTEALKKVIIR